MNLLLLFPDDIEPGAARACIDGRRLADLLASRPFARGDRLRVGLAGGRLGTGRVTQVEARRLWLDLDLDEDPPAPLPVTLVLALPRPKALRRIVSAIASLGVKRLYLVHGHRVDKAYWKSPLLDAPAIRDALVSGLEQAGDTVLPQVELRRRFKPFAEDELPALARGARALAAQPDATRPCPRYAPGRTVLAIGPEGGFVPFELELLARAGFEPVTLGPRMLRVETAVSALLGRLGGP